MTITTPISPTIRQRADLTFRENVQHGRHGWLRLTPAYSVKLVERILAEYGADACRVFEPFSGTGTTPLCAGYRGMTAVATDINPFLVWLGRTKSAAYTQEHVKELKAAATGIAGDMRHRDDEQAVVPPIKNIERWWNPDELAFLARLRAAVERAATGPVRDLLKVAFCRTMIGLSNAAFNHQSMSFKEPEARGQKLMEFEDTRDSLVERFLSDVRVVSGSVLENPKGQIRIEECDARGVGGIGIEKGSFDLLVTSPPYPNRMSYIRELRPYMYWLGYLDEPKEAGELDWEAIGGTWGIATSRLAKWQPSGAHVPGYLLPIVAEIRLGHPKNGELMAQYVLKYFEDMYQHFQAAARIMRPGGSAHYIIGNSSFYGNVVPAERLYCDQLLHAGFRSAEFRAIRKRNSKRELVEFHVVAMR